MQIGKKSVTISLYPKAAWVAIIGLIILIFLAVLARVSLITWLIYYLGSFAVGIFLYQRYPILYIGFTWWLWFVGPFVKRIIDYQSGYVTPGSWSLIPALVTFISSATLIRHLPQSRKIGGFPFILGTVAVFYGFAIEIIQQQITLRLISMLLTWLTPIVFGFHLFVNWRDYPRYRQNFQRVFLWGVSVMGVYGIWQFFSPLPWDIFWIQLDMQCLCFQNRLWSTMNTPFTFGAFMSGSLLLLLVNQTPLNLPIAVAGYLSLLLTLSRSAWLSWIAGFMFLFPSLKVRLQQRLIITIILIGLFSIPLINVEPFSEIIGSRMSTFSQLENDNSYNKRLYNFTSNTETAIFELFGKGLSSNLETEEEYSKNDAGILYLLLSLGWFGFIPYITGIFMLFLNLFYFYKDYLDSFTIAVRSVAISIFSLSLIGLPGVIGSSGMMLVWSFLGIAMAGCKYYQFQRSYLKQINTQTYNNSLDGSKKL